MVCLLFSMSHIQTCEKTFLKLVLQTATHGNWKQPHSSNPLLIDLRIFTTSKIHFCSLIQPLQWANETIVLFVRGDYPLKADRRILPTEPHLQAQRALSQFLAVILKLLVFGYEFTDVQCCRFPVRSWRAFKITHRASLIASEKKQQISGP